MRIKDTYLFFEKKNVFVPQQQITHRINRVKNAIRHPPLHTFPSSSRGLKRLRKRGAGEAARRAVDNVVENTFHEKSWP